MFLFADFPELEKIFHPTEPPVKTAPEPAPAAAPNPLLQLFRSFMGNNSPVADGATGPDGKPMDAGYAQHWLEASDKKTGLPANTAAWGDHVHDAPTGSQAHADDADIVIEKTHKTSSTDLSAQGASHARTTTVSTHSGDQADINAKTNSVLVSGSGVKLGGSETNIKKSGDGATSVTDGKYLEVGANHVEIGANHDTEASDGDATLKRGNNASIAIGPGEVGLKVGKSDHTLVKDVVQDEHGENREVLRKEGTSSQMGGGIGTDHASVTGAKTTDRADGSSATVSGGASANWETGQVAANAAYGVKDEHGKVTAVTGGGGVDLGENGLQGVDVNAGISKNGMSFKVQGGVRVDVSDPKPVGGRFVVTWKRTRTAGGGGSYGQKASAGVSGSVSDFEVGSRSFATEAEAKAFHDQHDSIFADTGPAATTLDGAFTLAVGESRGSGSSSTKGVDASASVEGATIAGGMSWTSADQIEVRRASLNVFEVTVSDATGDAKNLSMGGGGIAAQAGKSDSEHNLTTVRFDLSTADGKTAFEDYCRTHQVPAKGGKVVATEEGKDHTHFDGLSLGPLGGSKFSGHSWESTRNDEQGKHEVYGGESGEDFSYSRLGHFLGGKDQHKSYQLIGKQENDVEQGYIVEGTFSGESAISNLDGIYRMTGRDSPTRSRDSITDDMASGTWRVSADLPKERVDEYCDYIANGYYEFDYGAVSDLQKSLRAAKNNDDKMRAVTEFVASEDGKGLKNLGVRDQTFDVELADAKGKVNSDFPGRAGRIELETKVHKYGALLESSGANGPMMLGSLEQEIAALKERRKHVADEKHYLDLPDQMRVEELGKIDAYLGAFTGLRDQAAIEAVKIHGGEDMVGILDRQSADDQGAGERPKDPVQAQLYDLRDQISLAQMELARFEQENQVAIKATKDLIHGSWREGNLSQYGHANTEENHQANDIEATRAAAEKGLNELRMQFLHALDKPQVALQYGNSLRAQIEAQVTMAQAANEHYRQAARAMRSMKRGYGDEEDGKFWTELAEEDTIRNAPKEPEEIEMPAMDMRPKHGVHGGRSHQ